MEHLKKYFEKLLDKENRMKVIVVLASIIFILLLFSDKMPSCTTSDNAIKTDTEICREEYIETLEKRIEEIVSSIKGAGRTNVLITLQNGIEYVYATDNRENNDSKESSDAQGKQSLDTKTDSEEKVIVIDEGSGKKALVKTIMTPKIEGVVIVCEGAENKDVKQNIIEAVTTALGISSRRVCVTILSE